MGRLLVLLCIVTCLWARTQASVAPVADLDATFQVALYYNFAGVQFVQRCTGVIITDNWIVTSASCLCPGNRSTCNDDLSRWQIRFGATFLNNAHILGVSRIEIHPFWSGILSRGFDVALFRLAGSVNTFRPDMRPVLLPDSVEFSCENRQAGVFSWGTASSGLLNQLVVTPAVVATDFAIVATNMLINNVRDEIDKLLNFVECTKRPNCVVHGIAVQYADTRIGFCPTDFGAPLIWTTAANQRVLLGVASYRFSGPGISVDPNQPCVDVYTNGSRTPVVFQEIDVVQPWIRSVVTNVTIFGSVCGDGLIGFNEECDDGNLFNGDGCNATCNMEHGWYCSPSRLEWYRNGDDDDAQTSWFSRVILEVDFCRPSICRRMGDDDDDGSSGSIIALIIVLSIVGGILLLACLIILIVCCRKRKAPVEPVPVVEPAVVAPVAPMITTPASPIMDAPPTTPATEMSPVHMEIVTPHYGMGTAEVMPPIIQREEILQAPVIEATREIAPTTWLKE